MSLDDNYYDEDYEPELLDAARAYPNAQAALGGTVDPNQRRLRADACWYDTAVSDYAGSFGLARVGSPVEELVGDIVLVTYNHKSTWLYLVGSANLPTDLGIAREPWSRIADLALSAIRVRIEVRA